MIRWIRLFRNQYLGFWLLGLVLFALQEVPYMLMPLLRLDTNPIMHMRETSETLDLCEKILCSACIALMIFIVSGEAKLFSAEAGRERFCFCAALAVLLLNYFGWFLYFRGHQSLKVILAFLVALPPLYYILIGLWRGNPLLAATGCAFLIVHFAHVSANLKLGDQH